MGLTLTLFIIVIVRINWLLQRKNEAISLMSCGYEEVIEILHHEAQELREEIEKYKDTIAHQNTSQEYIEALNAFHIYEELQSKEGK